MKTDSTMLVEAPHRPVGARNSNIELLRIICILMVMSMHILYWFRTVGGGEFRACQYNRQCNMQYRCNHLYTY